MKSLILLLTLSAFFTGFASCKKENPVSTTTEVSASGMRSIREFGVLPKNDAETNTKNLQKAINWAAVYGAELYVEPGDEPYLVNGGIILKKNASLVGANGATARGTKHPTKNAPVGSVFKIVDEQNAFITVESATKLSGIQFWYANQELKDSAKVIKYPPTIQVSKTSQTQGVSLSYLTFYGEYLTMDFNATAAMPCESILIESCYGYPLGGEFIRVDYCYDIPRILHCHANPANIRQIGLSLSKNVIDAVVTKNTFTYAIDHTDNAQLIDVFTFGAYGGAYLGASSYGQMTNFNFDCVKVGVHKIGGGTFNRNWQIAQGSIIANAGTTIADIHPFIIEGQGHTAISNVEAFSGNNGALTNAGASQDFMLIRGDKKLTVSMFGSRMRNYVSALPVTMQNTKATLQAVACIDKNEELYNTIIAPVVPPAIYVMDDCESLTGWASGNTLSLDAVTPSQGTYSLKAEGAAVVFFQKKPATPFNANVTKADGFLAFELFISDVSKLSSVENNGALEISSGGAADVQELAWYLTNSMNLKNGWNSVVVKLSDGRTTGGEVNLSAVNFIRLYKTVTSSVVMKLDNIRFF